MKIATTKTFKHVFTIFSKINISKKTQIYLRKFKLIVFILSISQTLSFNNFNKTNTKLNLKEPINSSKRKFITSTKLNLQQHSNDTDTDKDGVVDILDLDDDNDGILDIDEGFLNLQALQGKGIIITINGAWILVPTSVYFVLPSDLSHGDEFWVPFLGNQYVKAVKIKFENTENGIKFIQTTAKHTIGNNQELDYDINYDFDNGGITAPIALSDNDEGYGIASIEYLDNVVISEYLGSSGKILESPILDTDNDGLINSRDTDSDNDGCSDVSEGSDNLTTIAILANGSNGGSLENLGTSSNLNGIPLPLGNSNGYETTGQNSTKAVIYAEQVTVLPMADIVEKEGNTINFTVVASAVKTSTFNIGVPNFTDIYGLDTSELITYEWYKETDLNTLLSTSKSFSINEASKNDSGTYVVFVKGKENGCKIQERVTLTIEESSENTLKLIENTITKKDSFATYPNPTNGDVNLLVFSNQTTQVKIFLFDSAGKEIYKTEKEIFSGKNKLEFNVKVKPGILFLKVFSKEVNYGTTKVIFK